MEQPTQGILADEENIGYILTCLQGADEIGVDTETSGLNLRNNVDYLMGFCVSVPGMKAYLPFRHKRGNLPMRYLPHLEQVLQTKDLIWHNRKFDMHSCKTIGIDPLQFKGKQYCTMIIAHLIDEEMYSKELDFLANKFLKGEHKYKSSEIHKMGELFGFENLEPETYKEYGSHDAYLTRRLKEVLWSLLRRQELDSVYWDTEAPFTGLLYSLEQRGVGVNTSFCESKSRLGRARMATIERELKFNPASPIALGNALLDELGLPVFAHTGSCVECKRGKPLWTHEGKASFNKVAMGEYDDILSALDNPLAKRITEYRGWQKAVSSLYDPLLEKVGPDGLIRTEFKQHGTVTGRLSASNPNLQQVPRNSDKLWNGNAKSAFTSGRGDGTVLIGWDYSQLELRLAASYGQEGLLLAEFEKAEADPFSVLAPLIFGKLTPETRHETKTFVYANLYGAGVAKIALQLGRPISEVEQLYKRYKESISGIISISGQVSRLIEQRGYVKYWDGRRRHIRNKSDSYKGWNSVCQGGGAQLVKKAMLRCQEFEDANCQMVLQVHDEITFVMDRGMVEKYEPMVVEAMTDWPQMGVNLAVEGKEWK